MSVAGPSARTSPAFTVSPGRTMGFWLKQVFWFERWYLIEVVDVRHLVALAARGADDDARGVDALDDAVALGDDADAGVAGHAALHAGADQRRLGAHQRHRLALHVRAHERAVGVVVLEERE